jgi:DNA-binding response OmpR family regulator
MAQAGIDSTPIPFPQGPPQFRARRGAILIVEDRDDVRQGLSQLLEFQGYVVFEAANFDQAFTQLESSPQGIALILLDLNLPGPGGEQVRATQLANPALSQIPVIVVSASGSDVPGGAALCAAAWIEKPFRFEQLLEEVRRFVLPEGPVEFKTSSSIPPPDA